MNEVIALFRFDCDMREFLFYQAGENLLLAVDKRCKDHRDAHSQGDSQNREKRLASS